MRISDWSSDVCSSDLGKPGPCAQVDGMKIGAAGNGGNPLLPERSALSPSPWHCFLRPKNDVQTIGYGNRRCRSFSILPYRPPPPQLSLSAIPPNLPSSHAIKHGGPTPLSAPSPTH